MSLPARYIRYLLVIRGNTAKVKGRPLPLQQGVETAMACLSLDTNLFRNL
jgi:hypothetical protein